MMHEPVKHFVSQRFSVPSSVSKNRVTSLPVIDSKLERASKRWFRRVISLEMHELC